MTMTSTPIPTMYGGHERCSDVMHGNKRPAPIGHSVRHHGRSHQYLRRLHQSPQIGRARCHGDTRRGIISQAGLLGRDGRPRLRGGRDTTDDATGDRRRARVNERASCIS